MIYLNKIFRSEKMNESIKKHLKNLLLTLGVMSGAFIVSLVLQELLEIKEHITTVFVFGVFIISLLSDGYFWGILAAFISMMAVNFAFAFPYFSFNFTIPENIISAIITIIISIITSALITKLKKWQRLRAEGEREKIRANLLRAISHDLRTPLTAIYGSSEALLENYEGLSDGQKHKLISGIKEDSNWLINMVENLLSVTRIDGGNIELVKTPTALDELVDATLIKFKKRYPEAKIKLELTDEVIIVPMDAMLIGQVLMNILENAVKHGVGADEIRLRTYTKGSMAVFEVSDNGCGIPEDRLGTIFSGSYDGGENGDMKKRTAGIGLSVCATIIKAHGGTITAENLPEGGAKFSFALEKEDYDDQQ